MGNRAIIKGKGTDMGVYVHWNGGYDSVRAFVEYCKLKGYRSPEVDSYGLARLCQVVGNFFGGTSSVGIVAMPGTKRMSARKMKEYWGLDNGIYELQNWDIVSHWRYDGVLISSEDEYHEGYDLTRMLLKIDECMPISEQLGKDYITADVVPVSELKIGDNVYDRDYTEKVQMYVVSGFGEPDQWCNGHSVAGVPYTDKYGGTGSNINEYLLGEFVRKVKKQ